MFVGTDRRANIELKFYKGGQIMPGGRRAPKGGAHNDEIQCNTSMTTIPLNPIRVAEAKASFSDANSGKWSKYLYKGGQFIPGGSRAPAGGTYGGGAQRVL